MNCSLRNNSSPREKIKNQREIHSQDWENEKMRKIAFPKFGKTEKRKKMAFPNLGRLKNSEKWLSQTWENRKMSQAAFPTPWKAKNAENSISNPSKS